MNVAPFHLPTGESIRAARRLYSIACFTLLEARRTRLPLIVVAVVLTFYGSSLLVREIAITESVRFQTGFLAAGLRAAAVFMVALYVLASWLRDVNDKILELMLALDLARGHYLLGKFAGFSLVAVIAALLCTLPLLVVDTGQAVLPWCCSLILELWIIVALSLFCINTLSQITAAAGFIAAFYLLARSIAAIQLMSHSSLIAEKSWQRIISSRLADALALVLPGLDRFTQTTWLVDGAAAWSLLPGLLLQTLIYCVLLLAAASFDLYRREM